MSKTIFSYKYISTWKSALIPGKRAIARTLGIVLNNDYDKMLLKLIISIEKAILSRTQELSAKEKDFLH